MTHQTDSVSRPHYLSQVAVGDDAVDNQLTDRRAQGASDALARPLLRGWIHLYCAIAAMFGGTALVVVSWALVSNRAGHATLAYALAIVAMFAVSAIYHRVHWESAEARQWMRRLDHSMIFVFIAGTYTPFARLAMPHSTGLAALAIVWGGAVAGIALTLCWPSAPRWVGVMLYLLLGWVAVWYMGMILNNAGAMATALLIVGGVLYSIGGVFYALRWPDPWPATFGYHEFFHAFTALAAVCQYIAIWYAVF
ncbi:hemolysin III family protein [Mycobacterium sp. TY815]|uniref:PAQR family membrane homeostasis protein TrhA n=1 Tax=Mycobacterium sp. TY815 TaxID=3050581 RepID=UPI0027409D55|nr:hemolysin III family protein [Mycobacterium sp. TY815]MDP7707508.1 hemolysin III family protein [Mycobacterium sp. TY815]